MSKIWSHIRKSRGLTRRELSWLHLVDCGDTDMAWIGNPDVRSLINRGYLTGRGQPQTGHWVDLRITGKALVAMAAARLGGDPKDVL